MLLIRNINALNILKYISEDLTLKYLQSKKFLYLKNLALMKITKKENYAIIITISI